MDHRLAQTISGRDENHVAEARIRIQREHDAGRAQIAAHHVLHADRERHGAVIEFVVHPIGYRAIVEQRGVHFVHGLEQMLLAAHVEECLLLAGKGGFGKVFRRCRGAHRDRELGRIARALHLAPGFQRLGLQALRKRRGQHPAANFRADDRQFLHIIHIERREQPCECVHRGRLAPGSRGRREQSWQNRPAPKPPESDKPEIISPMDAFLPPTSSTSLFFSFSNGMM